MTAIQQQIEDGYIEISKTRTVAGHKWFCDADVDRWWNEDMTACIYKHHSSKWTRCDSNMNRKGWAGSFKEAAEDFAALAA